MKRLFLVLLIAAGCGDSESESNVIPAGPAICEGGPNAPEITVHTNFAKTQAAPNALFAFDGKAYVVESLNNTVSTIDLQSAATAEFVDLGNDHNPYEVAVDARWTVIPNYLANTVTIADTATGDVLAEVQSEAFKNPSGAAILGDYIYVSNVDYIGPDQPYGQGTVSIIDKDFDVVATIPTTGQNPQYLATHEDKLIVVNTGEVRFDESVAYPATDGVLEIWTPTDDPAVPDVQNYTLPIVDNIGAPGRPVTADNRVYMGAGTSSAFFAFDMTSETWIFDAETPFSFPSETTNALTQVIGVHNQIVFATAFNEDALFLVDTRCDKILAGPIDLGESELIEGPIGGVLSDDGSEFYPLMSVSNSLGRLMLSWN